LGNEIASDPLIFKGYTCEPAKEIPRTRARNRNIPECEMLPLRRIDRCGSCESIFRGKDQQIARERQYAASYGYGARAVEAYFTLAGS
jgi:hypothetical protein